MPPGYGPWPLTDAQLKQKYAKFDLPTAKKLMADAGMSKGFSVTMTIVSLQDYPSVAALLVQQMKQINIDLNIKGTEIGTFAAIYNAGTYDWFLNGRGMRGDVDGFVQEFHPASATFQIQTPAYKNLKAWKDIGNGRIQLDDKKRLPMYKDAQAQLWTTRSRCRSSRSGSTRCSTSACRTCTWRSATSTPASARPGSARSGRSSELTRRGVAAAAPLRSLPDGRWTAALHAGAARRTINPPLGIGKIGGRLFGDPIQRDRERPHRRQILVLADSEQRALEATVALIVTDG